MYKIVNVGHNDCCNSDLKKMADKINDIVDWINTQKNINEIKADNIINDTRMKMGLSQKNKETKDGKN